MEKYKDVERSIIKKFRKLRGGLRPLHSYKEDQRVHDFLVKNITPVLYSTSSPENIFG